MLRSPLHYRALFPAPLICAVVAACGGDPVVELPTAASTPVPPGVTSHAGTPAVPLDPAASRWPDRASFALANHIPNNAVAYFEVRSIRELEEAVLRIQTIVGVDAEEANIAIATDPLSSAGIDPGRLDRNAPVAIAYVPAEGTPHPVPVILAPALDDESIFATDASESARGLRSKSLSAGYVLVENALVPQSTARGASPLVVDLPTGLLQGRFASDTFAPLLHDPLSRLAQRLNEAYRLSRPRKSASQLYEFDAGKILALLTSLDVVGIGASIDGDEADFRLRIARRDDAMLSGEAKAIVSANFADLARYVDVEDPMSFLVSMDIESTIERVQAEWDALVESGGEEAEALVPFVRRIDPRSRELLMQFCDDMQSGFHGAGAVSLCLEPAKGHVAIYLSAREKLRAREAISSLLADLELDTWGFELALPLRTTVGGSLVEDYSVRFDSTRLDFDQRSHLRQMFKTFLGDSTLHIKVATSNGHVLVVLGGDTAAVERRIEDFASRGVTAPHIAAAVEALDGADSAALVHTDVIKLVGQMAGIGAVASGRSVADTAREISRQVGDARAPFAFWSGTVGTEEIFGARFDLDSLSKAIDPFKESGL